MQLWQVALPMNRAFAATACLVLLGCAGPAGKDGARGPAGEQGPAGKDGGHGSAGKDAAVSGSRLKAQYQVGDDGSSAFYGWIDLKTGQSCAYSVATDGMTRCLPAPTSGFISNILYTDPSCSTHMYSAATKGPVPAYVTMNTKPQFYIHLGQAITPAEVYYDNGGGCMLVGPTDLNSNSYYAIDILQPDWFVSGMLTD